MGRIIQVQTTTGLHPVTGPQLAWLQTTGRLLDMSQHPQVGPVFPESKERLQGLLQTMPRENPIDQVDPEDPEGSIIDQQPQPSEETVILQLLREQRDAQIAIKKSLDKIAAFFDRPAVGQPETR